ncbi:hypothetical protein EGW08_021133 [Elysia chlorotica]|uniref:Ribosomal RNA-processing protein 14/surfeit locus protein 6 C-terminal domain-containing protein n=1 Tax=Elysia chlorotica TaxID=188477 RepID=A0A3S1AZD4_ELYCH|nr:hypothetical protein EGW08_021133 [Elysia chlorotica]
MVEAKPESESDVWDRVSQFNQHFKCLLDLVPPQSYFSQEQKDEIFGNVSDDDDEEAARPGKKRKKKGLSLSSYSVTQITEMRQRGEILGAKKPKKEPKSNDMNGTEAVTDNGIELKHQGKKQSRSSKSNKNKGKELEKREARLEELREKLRKKLEDMRAMKNSGASTLTQEQKRLRRKQSKLNAKLKKKGGNVAGNIAHKEQKALAAAQGLRSPPQNKIVNQNGQPVKSKFDFSVISFDNGLGGEDRSRTSDLHGRDYKRLLEKVEKRQEKVEQLKVKDPVAGRKLEEKFQWQAMMSKARGEKVKDDPTLLKKAAKRKEKVKEQKGRKWDDRKKATEEAQKKRQDRREANIGRRKDATKEKKRKKLIKKGRLVPGF